MRKSNIVLCAIGVLALLLTACRGNTVYNRYLPTNRAGWERNDTLRFVIPPVKEGGRYSEVLGLRTDGNYPFLSVVLIVEQTRSHTGTVRRDTMQCDLINNQGRITGSGINHYQYTFPLATIDLDAEESLRIVIRHDMKRELLPGITDVGIRMAKKQ
jgi:gliding motility-associated lipoprotein GldH